MLLIVIEKPRIQEIKQIIINSFKPKYPNKS